MKEIVVQRPGGWAPAHLVPPPPSDLPGRLPDFLVIGTAKGGTTALYRYLRLHPEVAMAREKELDFFLDPGVLPPDPRGFARGGWHLGLDWYRRWFQTDKVCGEASPNYTLGTHAEQVAGRIAAVAPGARLIYLVRHPLERMRSYFRMVQRRPRAVRLSWPEYLETSAAVATSCYGRVLEAYLRHFPRDRVLVLESAALDSRRRESLAAVFRFLGVDDRFWSSQFERKVYISRRRPWVSPLGERMRDAPPVNMLRRRLPPSLFYHVENLLLAPFAIPEPCLDLPPREAAALVARLQADTDLLRRLTGLALPSLDVTLEQALSMPARDG